MTLSGCRYCPRNGEFDQHRIFLVQFKLERAIERAIDVGKNDGMGREG